MCKGFKRLASFHVSYVPAVLDFGQKKTIPVLSVFTQKSPLSECLVGISGPYLVPSGYPIMHIILHVSYNDL